MAIANSDGSIILSTKVDTSGVKRSLPDIKATLGKIQNSLTALATQAKSKFTTIGNQIGNFFKNSGKKISGYIKNIFTKLSTVLNSLMAKLALVFSVTKLIQFSNEAGQLATQTEASVQRLVDIYGSASDSVGDFIDANARALGMSKAAAASFSSVYGNLFSVWADQATNAELTNRYLNMTAVVASKTGRTVEDVQERVRSGLLGNTEAIEDLGIFVNVKTIEMTDAFQRMANGKSWEQLDAYTQQQIRSMAILEQATAKYGDEVADTSATIRNRFNAAYQDFQNSWGNIVNTVLLPVLEMLTQIFDIVTKGLNALTGRSGQILENVELQEENTDKTAENIEEQTKNQKELNKELKKSLAGFDDIQILSANTAKNTQPTELDKITTTGDGSTTPDGSAYVNEANAMLTAIMGFVSVAMVAIGVILLLTGHIGWGLGFIIAGAGLLTVTQASVSQEGVGIDVQNALTTALLIAGVAAIVIGIILCMCQQYVKGIALIALGAATVVGDIAINWDSIKDMLSNEKVATWVAIGGILAVVLGILLCFAHQWWAGIGLIALGATALGVDIAVNWDAITTAIKDFVVENAEIIALISAGLLIIGILVCFVNLPLGIALIAAGAVGLVIVTALNWNAIVGWVKGAFEKVKEWISMYGGLVLGIILLFSGVGTAFGLALIIDSISSISKGEKPALWDSILESIKKTWNDIKSYWNANIANVWTLKFWLDLAKIAGNGLIDGFELAINGIIGMFGKMINWIINGLNKISFDIPDWLGGGSFGINIPNVSFGRVSIPRLAQGAVIPPNREFLAVLGDQKQGTNIEAPLQTIVDAFNIALAQNGGAGGGNTEVVLEIDGREFGRAVVEQGNRENRRIGTRLVIV